MMKKLIYLAVVLFLAQCGFAADGLFENFDVYDCNTLYPYWNGEAYIQVNTFFRSDTGPKGCKLETGGVYSANADPNLNWSGMVWMDRQYGLGTGDDKSQIYMKDGNDIIYDNVNYPPYTLPSGKKPGADQCLRVTNGRGDNEYLSDPGGKGPTPAIAWAKLPADKRIGNGQKKTVFFQLQQEHVVKDGISYVGLAGDKYPPGPKGIDTFVKDPNYYFPWNPYNKNPEPNACVGFAVPLRVWTHDIGGTTPVHLSYGPKAKSWVRATNTLPGDPNVYIAGDTWYNVWMVVDNNSAVDGKHKVSIYVKLDPGAANPNNLLAKDANFVLPVSEANGITRFALVQPFGTYNSTSSGPFTDVDNIYVYDGNMLGNPVTMTKAYGPTPSRNAVDYNLTPTFKWSTAGTDADLLTPNPLITGHYLYYKVNAGAYSSAIFVDATDGNPEPNAQYGPISLNYEDVVTWYVEEQISGSTAGDPNNIKGSEWTFTTFLNAPYIYPDEPRDRAAAIGESVTLHIDACDPAKVTTLQYRWYKGHSGDVSAPVTTKTTSPDYTIGSVGSGNFGYYWCMVSSREDLASGDCNLVEKKLLAHWTLDSVSRSAGGVTDSSASGIYDGTIINQTGTPITSVGGEIGNAFNFDCNTLPPNEIVKIDNKMIRPDMFTVAAWVKFGYFDKSNMMPIFAWSEFGKLGSSSDRAFIAIDPCATEEGFKANRLVFDQYYKNGPNQGMGIDSNIPLDDNQWHHVAVTFYNDNVHLYVDGAHDANGTVNNFNSWNDANMIIGGLETDDDSRNRFSGAIDDVRLYSYAMDKTEIANLYLDGPPTYVCVLDRQGADLNGDCQANFEDLAIFAQNWQITFRIKDLTPLVEEWLACGHWGDGTCPGAVLPYKP
jgi:hypothetical protein